MSGTYNYAPIVDGIQEFKSQGHNDLAEYGGAAGAAVSVVTKSGTNQYHGALWEYLRNEVMDATGYFAKTLAPLRQNQYGATIGGPLSIPKLYNGKNRTFFFAAWETYKYRSASETGALAATDAMRSGDFSALGVTLYDPMRASTRSSYCLGLVDATHIGGCGCCSGFGCTRRGGTVQSGRRPGTRPRSTPARCGRSASPHCARVWFGIDAEALELGAGRRAAGAELDAAVGDEVEHRDRLGGADRVVVRLGQQPHAVADADVLGARRDRAVEHLGVRAVRVLLEEVVLDGPERVEARLARRAPPARSCSCRPACSLSGVPGPGARGSRRTGRSPSTSARSRDLTRGRDRRDSNAFTFSERGPDGAHGGQGRVVTGAASGIGAAVRRRLRPRARPSSGWDLDGADGRRSTCATRPRSPRAVADVVAPRTAASTRSCTRPASRGGGPAHLVDREEWHRVLDVNLNGTFLVGKHAVARDARAGAGRRRARRRS